MTIIGVEWTKASSPTLTRIGAGGTSASYTGPASGGAAFDSFGVWGTQRRVNLWNDGTVTAAYGDRCYTDTDVTNMGQCMTECDAHLYFVDTTDIANKIRWYIADLSDAGSTITQAGGGTKTLADPADRHPAFRVIPQGGTTPVSIAHNYVSSYEPFYNVSLLESKSGVTPAGSHTIAEYRTAANARSTTRGWGLMTVQMWAELALKYIIEYASLNSQETLGEGVNHGTKLAAGYTAIGGTQPTGNGSWGNTGSETLPMVYRGVENLWGNTHTFIDGINVRVTDRVVFVSPQTNSIVANYGPYVGGSPGLAAPYVTTTYAEPSVAALDFVTEIDLSAADYVWMFSPKTAAGSASTYYCDGMLSPGTATHACAYGGGYNSYDAVGIFSKSNVSTSTSSAGNTTRLAFIPNA